MCRAVPLKEGPPKGFWGLNSFTQKKIILLSLYAWSAGVLSVCGGLQLTCALPEYEAISNPEPPNGKPFNKDKEQGFLLRIQPKTLNPINPKPFILKALRH